ncbi:N-alpha-acetyltransferase 50 [Cichlidogyrus casuarinus]|uniref:N-terminal methionine N(alpha)-acetyltransferase NatE n=1 Tax=Cichlidogyrus casuarinus TaxID=1844966 RepID=A0ABD2QN36_9PLAT
MSVQISIPNQAPSGPKTKKTYTITLGELTKHNLKQLRLVNQMVFPVQYSEAFYQDMLKPGKYCRLAYFNDIIVGAVCYRFDNIPNENGENVKKAYIMNLGCLSYYRRLGVGTKLLQHVINHCKELDNVKSIMLHVHTINDDALEFYKRHGFKNVKTVPNYYVRIEPTDAYELEIDLQDCKHSEE